MKQNILRVIALALLLVMALLPASQTLSLEVSPLAHCREIGFSTEEDFLSQGPTPPDGNPIISDGDLLGRNGICARNRDLVHNAFDVDVDVGLDAVDIISIEQALVAFSTELDSPHGNFKAGDLLTNQGAAVPNQALLAKFGRFLDLGLDSIHFIGRTDSIIAFLAFVQKQGRDYWLKIPEAFPVELERYGIDLWFSVEGTLPIVGAPMILDGDLLSAATGTVVYRNSQWLWSPIPAGIPDRGVDFGLDAFAADCFGNRATVRFSSEILYRHRDSALTFTDGDVLKLGGGIVEKNFDLIAGFEPRARMMGLDALTYPLWREQCVELDEFGYLPMILRRYPRSP